MDFSRLNGHVVLLPHSTMETEMADATVNALIKAAEDRIAALKDEVAKWESFLRMSAEAQELLTAGTPTIGAPALSVQASGQTSASKASFLGGVASAHAPKVSSVEDRPRTRVTDNPRPAVIIPAAIKIMRERGRPMSRRDLHVALADAGLVVNGADPVKALGTILWRAKNQIIQIEGRGYWPHGDPVPPANHWMDGVLR